MLKNWLNILKEKMLSRFFDTKKVSKQNIERHARPSHQEPAEIFTILDGKPHQPHEADVMPRPADESTFVDDDESELLF